MCGRGAGLSRAADAHVSSGHDAGRIHCGRGRFERRTGPRLGGEQDVDHEAWARAEAAVFRFEGGAPSRSLEPLPPGVVTNRGEYKAGPARNVTAILLDGLNTPQADQIVALHQALAYLRTIHPDTSVAVYRLTHELVEVHDFTSDAASLWRRMEEERLERRCILQQRRGGPGVLSPHCGQQRRER